MNNLFRNHPNSTVNLNAKKIKQAISGTNSEEHCTSKPIDRLKIS